MERDPVVPATIEVSENEESGLHRVPEPRESIAELRERLREEYSGAIADLRRFYAERGVDEAELDAIEERYITNRARESGRDLSITTAWLTAPHSPLRTPH